MTTKTKAKPATAPETESTADGSVSLIGAKTITLPSGTVVTNS